MGRKLEVKYLGTCEVVFLVGKGGTKLKNVASGKELKNLYHMVNLKVYKQDDMNTSRQDDDDTVMEEPTSNIIALEEPMCKVHENISAEDKLIILKL